MFLRKRIVASLVSQVRSKDFRYVFRSFTSANREGESGGVHKVHFNVEKTPVTAGLFKSAAPTPKIEEPVHMIELKTKTSRESRKSVRYNFSTDKKLRDLYISSRGYVLIGKLLEDLDALAFSVAHSHCSDGNPLSRPLTVVTASVDKIKQIGKISAMEDIILVGQVAWVGKSSLDILMEIHRVKDIVRLATASEYGSCSTSYSQADPSSPKPAADDSDIEPTVITPNVKSRLVSCLFTFAARDQISGKSCSINSFLPTGELEEQLSAQRESLAKSRKAEKQAHKNIHTYAAMAEAPSGSSSTIGGLSVDTLNALVERGQAMEDMPSLAHPNAVLMKRTVSENCLLCRPQNANPAGKVFGGYLMHWSYDLAMATAYMFAGTYPIFNEVSRIEFSKPVNIGDLVRLRSRVVYTSDDPASSMVKVEVTAQVMTPERASSYVTTTLVFAFKFDNAVSLKRILPTTHEEAITLIKAATVPCENMNL